MAESRLGRAYRLVYERVCGSHPTLRPWHFQWLAAHLLNRDLELHLPRLTGRVLDVGCGQQPYRPLLRSVSEYVGADVTCGPTVDVVLTPGAPWPFPDEYFDAVLMTQVLEYVIDIPDVVSEIRRILKPRGVAIISWPFTFNEHGANDYLRISANAAEVVFTGFDPLTIKREGAIGSTLGTLFLNWFNHSLNLNRAVRFVRPILLPMWLVLSFAVNALSIVMNMLDRTGAYYSNVFAVLVKKSGSASDAMNGWPSSK